MPYPTDCPTDVSFLDHPTELEARLRVAMAVAAACPEADLSAITAGIVPKEVVEAVQEGAREQVEHDSPVKAL